MPLLNPHVVGESPPTRTLPFGKSVEVGREFALTSICNDYSVRSGVSWTDGPDTLGSQAMLIGGNSVRPRKRLLRNSSNRPFRSDC